MAKCIGIENQTVLLKLKSRHFGPNSTYRFIWIHKWLRVSRWLGSLLGLSSFERSSFLEFLGLGHGGLSIIVINNIIKPIERLASLGSGLA